MNFFLSLAFNILSCALEENIKFLLTKFPEVAKLDKLLSSIWCLVHSYISMAWILVEQHAYNIASVCITTSRKKKKNTCRIYWEEKSVLCRTVSGNHGNSHVKGGSPCAAVTRWILQSFNSNGSIKAFTSWGAARLEAAQGFPRYILRFTSNLSVSSCLLPPLLSS